MKARSTGNKYDKGFSTLEILIAFAVIILCMGAVVIVTFGNQSISVDSQNNSEAIGKAQKVLEDARATSRFDFNLVNPKTETELSGSLSFLKKLEVRQVDLFTKQATSTISWQSGGRTLSVFFTTLFTNPDSVNGGGTCSSVLTGNWKVPQITTYEFGKDLLGDPSSGFPLTAIDVYAGKLFVSVNNGNGNNDPTFFIFGLGNPTVPNLITSMDNNPSVRPGLNSIHATNDYVYGANARRSDFSTCTAGVCGQLQIIDISVIPPVVVSTFKIPGVTGDGGQAIGESIFYKDGFVYLGLAKTDSGPEFNIIDVTTPGSPVYKGGYSVGNGVNDIIVRGDYAYIASPNTENMTILNISDPTNPWRVGGYSPAGGSNGKSLGIVGNTLYLGRTFGSNEFYILNITEPTTVSEITHKDIGTGNKTTINSLSTRDYLAFMITDEKFEVWNIADTANIYPWTPGGLVSEFQDLPGGEGTAMDCEGNYMYVGSLPSSDKGFISIITSS